jgi:hypothetical protein
MRKPKVNWNSKDVLEIIKDRSLTIQQMADKLGISYSSVAHKRAELGLERICPVGLDHALTNKETKARYNAKIKLIGYKPLYTTKEWYIKRKMECNRKENDMKYINAEKLKVEIERRIAAYQKNFDKADNKIARLSIDGRTAGLKSLLDFINTLEVKEVDLKKEIDNIWNPRFNLGWDEKSLLSINHEGFTTIAEHFFELGIKHRKDDCL